MEDFAAAVTLILGGATFVPSDLPGLDDQEQLVLARRLLRDGVVVPAGDRPAAGRDERLREEQCDRMNSAAAGWGVAR